MLIKDLIKTLDNVDKRFDKTIDNMDKRFDKTT